MKLMKNGLRGECSNFANYVNNGSANSERITEL